jgi:hypothetical protein
MTEPRRLLAALALAAVAGGAHADLQDEIQVYDDSINKPGERGLELHINTTPKGRSTPEYPGEVPPMHAVRVTPEFSWGATRTTELGLYLPALRRPDGKVELAGAKVRLKWIPIRAPEGGGFFGGVNFELSRLARRYSESRSSLETRFIAGWRNADWLVAVNPTLGFGLSDGFRGDRPSFDLGTKVSRRVGEGVAAGFELYSGLGPFGRPVAYQQQDNRLFLALDVDRAPWVFNVGVGYGLTQAADRWTLKAIVEVPLRQ